MEKEKKFIALYGKLNSPEDFLTVPFEILEYRRELNISASEFTFICEIFHLTSKDLNEIKDKDITENRISFFRQRKSLKSKGYLKTKILNGNKKWGTIYDFTELKKIIDKLKKSKQKSVSQLSKKKSIKEKDKVKILEDINREALQPRKLIKKEKTEEQKREDEEAKQFLDKYNKYHKDLLGFEINYRTRTRYKKYLLDAFHKRLKNINIEEALILAKNNFLELPLNKRESLKFQDLVRMALTQKIDIKNEPNNVEVTTDGTSENKINKDNNSIPNGIDNLNKLLKVIEKKGDINETYKTITNTA